MKTPPYLIITRYPNKRTVNRFYTMLAALKSASATAGSGYPCAVVLQEPHRHALIRSWTGANYNAR